MRAAIYARHSSDKQNPCSSQDQIAACRKWAAQNGHTVIEEHVYSDEAISGRRRSRPGINALMKAAQAKSFEMVLAYATDRLGRNLGSSVLMLDRIQSLDITLVLVGENLDLTTPDGKLIFHIRAMVAEMQSDSNRIHTIRGIEAAIAKGYMPGGACYGYKLKKDGECSTDADGRVRSEGTLALIIEEEAQVIQRIFKDFASGVSISKIVQALNTEQIPSYHGQGWSESTISKLLKRQIYIGKLIWGKASNRYDNFKEKALRKVNDPSKWIRADRPDMRIVSDELWNAVQLRFKELEKMYPHNNNKKGFRKQTKSYVEVYPDHLLSGLLKCEKCGGAFVLVSGKGSGYYGCQMAHKRKRCDCRKLISREKLEKRFTQVLLQQVMTPKALDVIAAAATKTIKQKFSHLPEQQKKKQRVEVDPENWTRV